MGMSKADRAELKAITKRRFKQLRTDVRVRAAQVQKQYDDRLKKDLAGDVARYTKKADALVAKNLALKDEMNELREEAKDAGVDVDFILEVGRRGSYTGARVGPDEEYLWRRRKELGEKNVHEVIAEIDRLEMQKLEELFAPDDDETSRRFIAGLPTMEALIPGPKAIGSGRAKKGGE